MQQRVAWQGRTAHRAEVLVAALTLGTAAWGQTALVPATPVPVRARGADGRLVAAVPPSKLELPHYGLTYTPMPEPWVTGPHTGEDVHICIHQMQPREDMDLVITVRPAEVAVPTSTYLHRLLGQASTGAQIEKQSRLADATISGLQGKQTDWEHTYRNRRYTIAWVGRTEEYVYTVRVAGPQPAKAQVQQVFAEVSKRVEFPRAMKAVATTQQARPAPTLATAAGKAASDGDPFATHDPAARPAPVASKPTPPARPSLPAQAGDPFVTAEPKPYTPAPPTPYFPPPAPPRMPESPSPLTLGPVAARPQLALPQGYWYESPLGYKFGGADVRPIAGYSVAAVAPEAETAVAIGDWLYGIAIAMPTFGEDVDPATFAQAALRRLSVQWNTLENLREVKEGTTSGYTGGFSRLSDRGVRLDYRFKVLRGQGRIVMVLAWSSGTAVSAEIVANSLTLSRPQDLPGLTEGVRRDRAVTYAQLMNEVGVELYANRKFAASIGPFRRATELHADKSVYMHNLISAMEQADRMQEALPYVEKAVRQYPNDPAIAAAAAAIHKRLDHKDKALTLYAQAFRNGMTDDLQLEAYIGLLLDEKKQEEAQSVAEQVHARAATARTTALLATVYQLSGKPEKGISALEGWMARSGPDAELSCVLMSILTSAQRYSDALKAGEKVCSAGRDTARVWYWMGNARMGLKQYYEARQAYDKSLALDPGDTRTLEARRIAASMLGEGDRRALAGEIPPVQVPARLLTEPPGREEHLKDHDGIYLYHVRAVSYQRGEDCVVTEYYGVSPVNQEGVRRFNPTRVTFDPLQEEICLNRMIVRDEKGNVVSEGTPADAHIMDEPSMIASYRKVLTVPLPGLKPGYTADLAITRRKLRSAGAFDWTQYLLSSALPVGRSAVVLRGGAGTGGAGRPALAEVVGHVERGCSPTTESDGTMIWEQQWPAEWKWEPMAAEPSTYLPTVVLGDRTATWASEGNTYVTQLADFVAPSPEAKALWETIWAGASTEEERLARILEHVQTQYTYQAIAFGRRARIPQPVAKIIANRYGDCKDHSLLTYHLLKAAGLPAQLVLARTEGELTETLPSLDQFDHMICWTKVGGKERFLDTTYKSADISGGVPFGLEGRAVLLLDSTPHLVRIPAQLAAPSVVEISRELSIGPDGDAEVTESATMTGAYAGHYRESLAEIDAVHRRTVLRGLINAPAGMDLKALKIDHLSEPAKPLVLEMKYTLRRHLTLLRGELVGSTPALVEAALLSRERCDNRQSPMKRHTSLQIRSKTSVSLAAGVSLEVLPQGAVAAGDAGKGTSRFEKTEKGYTASLEAEVKGGEYSAADYGRYCDEVRNVLELYTRPLLAKVTETK